MILLHFCSNLFSFIQFVVILESVLAKLSRYDEGTLFSSFLSFTVSLPFTFFWMITYCNVRTFLCNTSDFYTRQTGCISYRSYHFLYSLIFMFIPSDFFLILPVHHIHILPLQLVMSTKASLLYVWVRCCCFTTSHC